MLLSLILQAATVGLSAGVTPGPFQAILLSPGPWLFWSLINGPALLEAWAVSPWWGAAYLAGFYGVFILTNLVLIGLFATLRKTGEKVRKALLLVSAIALAGFAMYQFLQGLSVI